MDITGQEESLIPDIGLPKESWTLQDHESRKRLFRILAEGPLGSAAATDPDLLHRWAWHLSGNVAAAAVVQSAIQEPRSWELLVNAADAHDSTEGRRFIGLMTNVLRRQTIERMFSPRRTRQMLEMLTAYKQAPTN